MVSEVDGNLTPDSATIHSFVTENLEFVWRKYLESNHADKIGARSLDSGDVPTWKLAVFSLVSVFGLKDLIATNKVGSRSTSDGFNIMIPTQMDFKDWLLSPSEDEVSFRFFNLPIYDNCSFQLALFCCISVHHALSLNFQKGSFHFLFFIHNEVMKMKQRKEVSSCLQAKMNLFN